MRRAGDELPLAGRLLAIDLGRVRIGLALSDASQVVAAPLGTLDVVDLDLGDAMDVPALAARLSASARDIEGLAGVVVGVPLGLDGHEGAAAREARAVADELRSHLDVPVRLVDERFTTAAAERALLEGDVSRAGRRAAVDRIAASVLLQGVLEAHTHRREGR
jgi:putative holliday junction resolvase